MSCISHLNLCPASGDTDNQLLQKILQSLIAGGGGGGGGVTGISINGGPILTGDVSIATGNGVQAVNGDAGPLVLLDSGEIPEGANLYFTNARAIAATLTGFVAGAGTVTAADSILTALQKSAGTTNDLLNFRDSNAHADASIFINSGATEIIKVVGATTFVQMNTARIHRDVDNSQIAFLGGTAKSTGAFLEVNGDTAASPGDVTLTTKGRVLGAGTFKLYNAPVASLAQTLRAQMTWEGDWSLTPTWNDAADAFVAFDVNPTNTASAAGALLGRFRASSVSQWEVSKAGATTQLGSGTMTQLRLPDTSSASVGGIYFNSALSIHNFGAANIFAGHLAGNLTLTGTENVGIGVQALQFDTTGSFNVANGFVALRANTTGDYNAANGYGALTVNTTGIGNVATGALALQSNTTGDVNIGIGYLALRLNTTGMGNIATGFQAGDNITTGSRNIIIGYDIDSPTATNSNTLTIGNLIFGTAIDGTGTTVSSGNIAVGIVTPFQKFSVLGASGSYELATDSANYSRTSIAPAAGNHLIRTEAAGTGTLRILQVGTGPRVGTDIAGINTIFHSGQPTGNAAPGAILFQQGLPAGGSGAGVTALATIWQINTSGSLAGGAGFAFSTASGTNQRGGNLTLVGGTQTVANTSVTANTIVMLTRKTSGGTIGTAITYTTIAATSFTVTSDSVLDTSVFSYFLIEVP